MRRLVLWLASTVTVVVLLFGYHTSTDRTSTDRTSTVAAAPSPSSPVVPSASPSSTATGSSSPEPSSSPSSASAPSAPAAKSGSYTGSVAQTRWGPVQVEITVKAGRVTGVTVPQQPNGNPRDVEINDQALPTLIADTLSAQSADVDMVSGATVTSEGYLQSLQSALDQAGI